MDRPLPGRGNLSDRVAAIAYFASDREFYRANEFSFFPVKEVGLLFLSIFATMVSALASFGKSGRRTTSFAD